MVKVLIYSSKEIYDNASFDGRAEAHIIAYREGDEYVILKDKTDQFYMSKKVSFSLTSLSRYITTAEKNEWERDMQSYKLKESYRNHPITTLMKNEPADV